VISELRLTGAADTLVGSEFIRGVSGGEKRRLTLAEMLVRRVSCVRRMLRCLCFKSVFGFKLGCCMSARV
jgi:hypothetical protein